MLPTYFNRNRLILILAIGLLMYLYHRSKIYDLTFLEIQTLPALCTF